MKASRIEYRYMTMGPSIEAIQRKYRCIHAVGASARNGFHVETARVVYEINFGDIIEAVGMLTMPNERVRIKLSDGNWATLTEAGHNIFEQVPSDFKRISQKYCCIYGDKLSVRSGYSKDSQRIYEIEKGNIVEAVGMGTIMSGCVRILLADNCWCTLKHEAGDVLFEPVPADFKGNKHKYVCTYSGGNVSVANFYNRDSAKEVYEISQGTLVDSIGTCTTTDGRTRMLLSDNNWTTLKTRAGEKLFVPVPADFTLILQRYFCTYNGLVSAGNGYNRDSAKEAYEISQGGIVDSVGICVTADGRTRMLLSDNNWATLKTAQDEVLFVVVPADFTAITKTYRCIHDGKVNVRDGFDINSAKIVYEIGFGTKVSVLGMCIISSGEERILLSDNHWTTTKNVDGGLYFEEFVLPSKNGRGSASDVCYAFLKGECFRGNGCRFSHNPLIRNTHDTLTHINDAKSASRGLCRFGKSCNKTGCRFFHPEERVF